MVSTLHVLVVGTYALLAAATVYNALRRPDAPRLTVAAFFVAAMGGTARLWSDAVPGQVPEGLVAAAGLAATAMPWLLVRLAGQFHPMPRFADRLSTGAFFAAIGVLLLPDGLAKTMVYGLYFVGEVGYGGFLLVQAGRKSRGVALVRIRFVSVGALFIPAITTAAIVAEVFGRTWSSDETVLVLSAVAGACFFYGFATPRFVRRWWRAAEIERFLQAAGEGPAGGRAQRTVALLPKAARDAADGEWAGLALPRGDAFAFDDASPDAPFPSLRADDPAVARAFETRAPILVASADVARWLLRPGAAKGADVETAFLVPLLARDQPQALLVVLLRREPLFHTDVAEVLALLAEQAARAQEEARLQRELEAAVVRSERLSVLGTLVAAVAHETNNLLTYSRGNVELALLDLDEGIVEPEELRAGLKKVAQGLDQVARLTRSLKVAAREGNGQREKVDVNDLVRDVHDLISLSVPRNVDVQVDLARSQDLKVLASTAQLHQVVLNLAKNAMEALGERKGRIVLGTSHADGVIEVRVSDDGPGVPPEVAARLFQPFFTTKRAGTGLGLSISRRIANEHGGDLVLDPPGAGGATFRLRLPASG